jgi:hypothetical protein
MRVAAAEKGGLTADRLAELKAQGLYDRQIGEMYGMKKHHVQWLRVREKIDGASRKYPKLSHCQNEHCGRVEANGIYRKGLCSTCYQYQLETGEMRIPKRKYSRVKNKCDCGQPATHFDVELQTLTVDTGAVRPVVYNLCEQCYRLEFGTR